MMSTTSTPSDDWTSNLPIKQLKQLVQLLPNSESCLERSDYEELVKKHYSSSSQAESTLAMLERLQQVLCQDRGVHNFEDYTPSKRHQDRLVKLQAIAPELYDNPSITPRTKWFDHPMYRRNSQMPPYHVHFRQEMQTVIQYLSNALKLVSCATTSDDDTQQQQQQSQKEVHRKVQSAKQYFESCMRGLNGHVRIEEYACFPLYQHHFPKVNLKFLHHDHKELHDAEDQVRRAFDEFFVTTQEQHKKGGDDTTTTRANKVLDLLNIVLQFDEHLMQHLGEEEELVVPLSLTKTPIHF